LVHFRACFRRVRLRDLRCGGAPNLALRLRGLSYIVTIGSDSALGATGGRRGARTEAGGSALVAQRYRPTLLGAQEAQAVVKRHTGEQLAAELDTGALRAVGTVQVFEAGPVEDGDSVVPHAIKVQRLKHESRASMTVVELGWVGRLRWNYRIPARDTRQMILIIGKTGSVRCR